VVTEIANAASSSRPHREINKALAQMDEVTQQNSALVEENAAPPRRSRPGQIEDDRVAFFGCASRPPKEKQSKSRLLR